MNLRRRRRDIAMSFLCSIEPEPTIVSFAILRASNLRTELEATPSATITTSLTSSTLQAVNVRAPVGQAISCKNNPTICPKHDRGRRMPAGGRNAKHSNYKPTLAKPLRYIRRTGRDSISEFHGKNAHQDGKYAEYDVSVDGQQWFHLIREHCVNEYPPVSSLRLQRFSTIADRS
jgi:hypothetical protein